MFKRPILGLANMIQAMENKMLGMIKGMMESA
jgi:hypothetical protein